MKHSIISSIVIACSLSILPSNLYASATDDTEVNTVNHRASRLEYVPGELIVKFKSSSKAAVKAPQSTKFRTAGVNEIDRAFAEIGVAEIEELMPLQGAEVSHKSMKALNGRPISPKSMQKTYRVRLSSKAHPQEAMQKLSQLTDVEFVEPNYIVHSLADDLTSPDDPYYSLQYGIMDVNLPILWSQEVLSKEGPIIAILDTGIDTNHPDLCGNIWVNQSEAGGAGSYDDDGNGYVDDITGWDFVNNSGKMNDYNGHGTHCAGIAAASGYNGIGIIGANPDARIMPLTVLQSTGQGDIATIIKAIDYAAANGAQIISMSLGTYAESMALEQALAQAYQKCLIVAAAGNDGMCLNHAHPERGQFAAAPMFPAAYTFVLGVQASNANGGLANC